VSGLLVVAASEADVELTRRSLEQCGLGDRLEVARDGEEALDRLFGRGAWGPASGRAVRLPRLVLLDLRLPKVDGPEVLQQLKADPRTRTVPVVVFTGSADDREVARCYQLGANSCIAKPVTFEAFRDVVAHVGRYWLTLSEAPFPVDGFPAGGRG
jgi:two-component system, response regulator